MFIVRMYDKSHSYFANYEAGIGALGIRDICLFFSMDMEYGILVVLLPGIWDTVINFRDIEFLGKKNNKTEY